MVFYFMAATQCPQCSREVKSTEGVPGRFECPHCRKELGERDEENGGGWFLPWVCLVALFGIIILDGLMNPDTLKNDQSFLDSITRTTMGFGISLSPSLFSYSFSSSGR